MAWTHRDRVWRLPGSPIVVHKFPLYARLAEIQPIRYYDTKRTFTPVGAVDEAGVEWPSKGDIE